LRVIQGTGRGQLRKITGNTPTNCLGRTAVLDGTPSGLWKFHRDYNGDSTTINNADPCTPVVEYPTDNFIDQRW